MADQLMPGRAVVALATLGGLVLAGWIAWALITGDPAREASALLGLAWGQVLLVDVYLGFALFGAWIAWREGATWPALAWLIALLTLGNVVACLYLLQAWYGAGGRAERFWHGRRSTPGGG